ncbi:MULTISPECIES: hypothetical protein [unclassified Tolypothrix]|nr:MULTISPECIES: hypothetical protein [unclassified Tolypothrix]EKF01316.1 hypothetical protein FDUTEX481_07964 [Tolypothrix sp. PCC 7601]MBE9086386.1 hypothetical protein [Tolypothrix sp. LEGE 11397]UYD30703.1 hypothetical protein HGR01_37610 [Tolypothrix sp. PCC 7712]UYD38546.1 hypothetical protein HG267_38475 [Tolypothrix sp. PCC 7601]
MQKNRPITKFYQVKRFFKLPKPLSEVLRAAAKKRNTTATDLVIQSAIAS